MSTAPWDQPTNGTTVTIWESEYCPLPAGATIHHSAPVSRRINGVGDVGVRLLISWPNPDYRPQ